MATIALYKSKVNQMGSLINDLRTAVNNYKEDLNAIKNKVFSINRSICNLDDVINTISSSTRTQDDKVNTLRQLENNLDDFVMNTVQIDGAVSTAINKSKNDFYDRYRYLKPNCEKTLEEQMWDAIRKGFETVGEWCKKNWVAIVSALAVVLMAVLAVVTFGLSLAFVAAIAGIVSLALALADVICMFATGKDIATLCNDNGLGWLGQIFKGVSVGCDIVSIAFPLAGAAKTISKVGLKQFLTASWHSVKDSFRNACKQIFRSGKGFWGGVKNAGKLAFKTFVFDIDDFKNPFGTGTQLKNVDPYKHWIEDGDNLLPNPNTIPGKGNPDKLTMENIMHNHNLDSIPRNKVPGVDGNGLVPDLSKAAIPRTEVPISMKGMDSQNIIDYMDGKISEDKFSDIIRDMNFKNADNELSKKIGYVKDDLSKELGMQLTWHEDINFKNGHYTAYLVPTDIHGNIGHIGLAADYKHTIKSIPVISRQISERINQRNFRFGFTKFVCEVK